MAISRTQLKTGTSTADNVSATFDSSPTEGALLVAVYHSKRGSTSPTITPSGWTKTIDLQTTVLNDRFTMAFKVAAASESTTVTFDYGTSIENSALVIAEYDPDSGKQWKASPVDVSQSAQITQDTTSKSTGTTAATAQNDELALAGWALRDSTPTGRGYTNSFTEVGMGDYGPGDCIALMAQKILTTTGTQETTGSWTESDIDATAGIICFMNEDEVAGIGDYIGFGIPWRE